MKKKIRRFWLTLLLNPVFPRFTFSINYPPILFTALLFLLFFSSILASPAQAQAQCSSNEIEWLEHLTESFAIIYPSSRKQLGNAVINSFGESIDDEYGRFSVLFGTTLATPISIRIYPTETDYFCLNPLTVELSPDGTHSHVGWREIALIGENITADMVGWQAQGLNALRHEIAVLFVEKITDREAPPGLMTGVGTYAQDPNDVFSWGTNGRSSTPEATWRSLWERPTTVRDASLTLQATSIVAYLIDVYGWDTFLQFLQTIPTAQTYRHAANTVYDVTFDDLEEQWQLYYPIYFQGRWRAHVIYGLDLNVFERLFTGGAYTEVVQGIKESITFLKKMGETDKASQAQALLEKALVGQEAGLLVRQSRLAILESNYIDSIRFGQEAREKFNEIGATDRLDEITAYQAWAQEILDLLAEAAEIQAQIAIDDDRDLAIRLSQIGQRLGELGEKDGLDTVETILDELAIREQKRFTKMGILGAALCLLLLLHRIFTLRRSPPVEAQIR